MKETLERRILLPQMDAERVADEIGDFIVNEITSIGYTGGVIGLSGGVDSTTTAALAKRAFDKYDADHPDRPLELVAYMLPTKLNGKNDTQDGVRSAERLGIRYEIQSLQNLVTAYEETNPEALANPYHKGNLISTVRGDVLDFKARTEKKLIIGTGNKDEDFGVGYYTLFGDGRAHMSPIAGLPKRLVRQMAMYLGFGDMANRTPAAGLETGQTDFKDLGYDYDVVELVSEALSQGFTRDDLTRHSQVAPLVEEQLQRYESAFGSRKFSDAGQVTDDIIKRNQIAKGKARILHPPTPEITLEYG